MFASLEKRGYTFGKKIGEGSSSVVFRAKHTDKKTGKLTELACKIVDKNRTHPVDFLEKFFPREIDLLSKVNHLHIVGVQGILESKNVVFIFLRWAENGDLLNFIQQNGAIEEGSAKIWFEQLTAGLSYIHSLGYAHRDLKCENIFISCNNNLKIGDFGYSRSVISSGNKMMSETYCGSKLYAAPEILQTLPYDAMKSDVFSLGVTCFIMCNGTMPFEESRNNLKLLELQRERKYNINQNVQLSADCWEMILALMEPEPTVRITAKEISTMNWMKR